MSTLLKKGTSEKDAVVPLNIKVGVTLPTDFDSGAMANETSLAGAGGYKKISGHVVYTVVQALPPPDNPVRFDADVMREIGVDSATNAASSNSSAVSSPLNTGCSM